MPTEAIVSVTNRCDARCSMCNIWRLDRQELMQAEDYRRNLPRGLRNVNVTGGEALLRPDIVEIVHAIHEACGAPRIIVATNGFRTEATLEQVARMRTFVGELGVAVSIDGLAPVHDRMRGVPRAFERAVRTIRGLKAMGLQDLRIGFTATPANIDQLLDVHALAGELDVEFAATLAQNSDVYYATDTNVAIDVQAVERRFGDLIRARLRSGSPKEWLRAYFDHGVIRFARTGRRMTGCDAASSFFFVAPTGDLYPCLTLPRAIGNLKRDDFATLWSGPAAAAVRAEVARCSACWMMCTARTELVRRPIQVAAWVATHKVRAAVAR